MPGAILVRYRAASSRDAEENEGLVRTVFADLAASRPPGLRYAAFRLEDGAGFLHVAMLEHADQNPLVELPAFQAFQRGIAERCDEPPTVGMATLVGAYRMLG